MSRPDPNSKATLSAAWFALLVGPIAWSAQLLVAWVADEFGCGPGGGGEGIYGIGHGAITAGAALVASAASAVGIVVGGRTWRRFRGEQNGATERAAWMGLAGVLTSAVFLVAILPGILAPAFLEGCTTSL